MALPTRRLETNSSATVGSQYYNGIDLMKFICALLVFFIHYPPFPGGIDNDLRFGLSKCLCRVAVPFYFVCSGFFLFRKIQFDNVDVDRVRNYCFKLLRLLGMWSVLLFFGGAYHLWYLGSTVVAITLLSLCLYHKVRFKLIVVLACLLYIIGLLGDSYYGLVAPLMDIPIFRLIIKAYFYFFRTTRNGIFMGLIFVLIGASFDRFDFNIKLSTAVVGTIISMICLFAEAFLLRYFRIQKDYNMYIFLVPAVFFIFSVCLRIQLKDRPIYQRLRNAGLLIYFSHVMIGKLLLKIATKVSGLPAVDVAVYLSIPSLVVTLLVAFWIEWLSHKKKFHWINWFLS